MSNFVNRTTDTFCKNAARSAQSSCVASFNVCNFLGTVFAVPVLLFAGILATLGLMDIILISSALLSVIICLKYIL